MYRCKKCGSSEVESKMWVQQNTLKIEGIVDDDNDQNWCQDCEELVEIYNDELTKLNND